MQVVLLAAGSSSRFIPFNKTFAHKSLVSIMGKTLIEHTIERMQKTDITNVVIVVGPQSPIPHLLGNGEKFKLTISYVTLPEPLGMGAAILAAKEHLEEKFFVLNAYHLEFAEFAKEMEDAQKTDKTVVLLGKEGQEYETHGFIKVNGSKVAGVIEKPKEAIAEGLQIVGMYLLNKTFLQTLTDTPLEHYHFEKALDTYAKNTDVTFVKTDRQTFTLKYAWDLFAIKDYLLSQISAYTSSSAKIAKTAQISGNVYISDNVTVMDGVVIKGSCFIGEGAYIGTNSLVRNGSVIEREAVVGSYLELKNTVIMEGSTTHTGVLEDSLVGRNCKIAAGIITANVRLDRKSITTIVKEEKTDTKLSSLGVIMGDNVQLGVRVTTMPGTIIGTGSIIGPYTVVMKNLEEKTKYYTKFQEVVEAVQDNG